MAKMRRRVKTLCNQLGVPLTEDVFSTFEEDAEITAEIVRLALSDILDEIKLKSSTGTLDGYKAVKIPLKEKQEVILPQSRFSVVGNFEWLIYVEARAEHIKLDLNVFEALDQGRPPLRQRSLAEGPYPLWNSSFGGVENRRVVSTKKRLSIGEGSGDGPRRTNEALRGKGNVPKGLRIPVTYGPVAEVKGLNLYDAALRRAKDRLSVKGLSRRWDVIKVGFK
jgi:hypothetical protein